MGCLSITFHCTNLCSPSGPLPGTINLLKDDWMGCLSITFHCTNLCSPSGPLPGTMLSRFRAPPPQWSVRRRIAGRTFPSNISLANVWDSSVCDTSPGLGCEMALNGKVCPSCSRRSIFPSLQAFMRHSKQLTCSFGFEDW